METRISVAIVGTGLAGLAAIKEFSGAGFDVTAFERYDEVAGIWAYHEDPSVRSVAKSTLPNVSKYMFCYSDFPMPKDYPMYAPHEKIKEYCDAYCEKFELKKHVKFRHDVVNLRQTSTGKWRLTSKSAGGLTVYLFDKVLLATGRHQTPIWPKIDGLEDFRGSLIHVSNYKRPEPFQGRTVLVVGIGNSGLDCCVDLSKGIAKQVYVSGRGFYIFPRLGFGGRPMDLNVKRSTEPSTFLANLVMMFVSWLYYGSLQRYGFGKPPRPASSALPAINGNFVETLATGNVIARPKLAKIVGPHAVQFDDGTTLDGVDDIIMATGFRSDYSFFKTLKYTGQDTPGSNKVELYKGMLSLAAPDSLAFIGRILTPGLLPTITELQCRYLIQLYKGNVGLPEPETMRDEVLTHARWIERTRYDRHDVAFRQWTPYMDWLAEQIGCDVKSRLTWGLWFYNRTLYNHIAKGPFSGHQYRIWGPGAWDGAIEALANVNNV